MTAKSGCQYNTPNPKVPKFEVCDTSELSEVLRFTALLGEERTISDALALRVDELKAELGDLPESQSEMMAEIKRLKAYAAKADIELGNLEDKLREAHAMSATLSHAARVSHRWEQGEIDKVKARVRAALEETKG